MVLVVSNNLSVTEPELEPELEPEDGHRGL